ncbi:hypothetical protein Taro_046086 [Colocasia esculenta]|uniref:DUF547 domain-containing protein n=1 Tax=Colocasia esculenta TaxID=4460 RepID=A0A843WRB0_COLES|nr:hypothetical protein [Colocasia esculenta]
MGGGVEKVSAAGREVDKLSTMARTVRGGRRFVDGDSRGGVSHRVQGLGVDSAQAEEVSTIGGGVEESEMACSLKSLEVTTLSGMTTEELAESGEDATDMPGISCQRLQYLFSPLPYVSRWYPVWLQITSGYAKLVAKALPALLSCKHYSALCISSCVFLSQPETELLKEIAALELEVLHLERYLLSLYKAAFDHQLAASGVKEQPCESTSTSPAESSLKESRVKEKCESKLGNFYQPSTCTKSCNSIMDKSCIPEDIQMKSEFNFQHHGEDPRNNLCGSEDGTTPPTGKQSGDCTKPTSRHRHRSLAEHLGSSITDCVFKTPGKLSEEIIKCISSIYNKLAEQIVPQMDFSASPISSISSSSTFSPRDTHDTWSPNYHYEFILSPYRSKVPKDRQGPYTKMVEIHKICIDDDRFDYAVKMLQNFRALIGQLEVVDPTKMEHEEKLAFWINIHNALVMHAYLAYGLHHNQMKSTPSIMKAAYNVGGTSINAQEIQSSIFCCLSHHTELRLQKLFSQKLMKRRGKHPYALDQAEPLVHFALCMGAYSDPAVRIYTAKNVLEELELAKDEFIQSNVLVRKEAKIILPKVLRYYAGDAAMDFPAILQMAQACMPETQQKAMQICLKGRPKRCVEWSSYKSDFRYIIHDNVVKE